MSPDFGPRILRAVSLLTRITVNPSVCHGKPVIRGLRYPVESMLDYLAAGDSIDGRSLCGDATLTSAPSSVTCERFSNTGSVSSPRTTAPSRFATHGAKLFLQ